MDPFICGQFITMRMCAVEGGRGLYTADYFLHCSGIIIQHHHLIFPFFLFFLPINCFQLVTRTARTHRPGTISNTSESSLILPGNG